MRQMREQNGRPGRGERIAKVIARAGLASRREAEAWIAAGRVAVNGAVIASPALSVAAGDRVTVDGQALPARERTRLFLYHKPRGLVTSHADPGGRPTIFAALPKGLPRLITVGRLDLNTEGLILLTNDGGLARVLELPATGWLRRYRVRAHGRVRQDELDRLRGGITIDGVRYGAIEARLDREQGSNAWLTFAIREGKNREVKNVLGHLVAVSAIRVSFGPFQLGDLAEGAIEEVKTRVLREQLGERVVAAAGADFSAAVVEREVQRAHTSPLHPEARAQRASRATARADHPSRRGCAAHLKDDGVKFRRASRDDGAQPRPTPKRKNPPLGRRAAGRTRAGAAGTPAAAPAAARQETLMRIVGGRLRGRALAAPKSHAVRPTADRLREALQRAGARLRRSGHRRARARPVCRHRRARAGGALARRRLRAVRRRRRRGARAHPRERGGARSRRRDPHLPPRRHAAGRRASGRAVLARLPRSALWAGPGRKGFDIGAPADGSRPTR